MAKSKAKKLSSKELEAIRELQNSINTIIMNLGNAVIVQQQLVAKQTTLAAEWKTETAKLEKKYGNVNISLEDGLITDVPVEELATAK